MLDIVYILVTKICSFNSNTTAKVYRVSLPSRIPNYAIYPMEFIQLTLLLSTANLYQV